MTDPLVLTVEETAELCRVSTFTVAGWTRTGVLPRLPGRRIRIPAKAVHRLLEEGYDAQRGKPNRPPSTEAAPSRGRDGRQADGPLASSSLDSGHPLHRPIGPKENDVDLRIVKVRGR